jgi:hypothetical protein
MTLSDWYSFFQFGSIVTLFLAFAFGAGAILVGLRINKASGRQILALETRLAEANITVERIKADAARDKRESDEKIAKLSSDAASSSERIAAAQAEAAEANARAKKSEAQIAAANAASKDAVAKVSAAEARLAEANRAASEANARALEASLELAKFKAPRKLLPDQQERIITRLKPFSGQVFAFSVASDSESVELMNEFDKILKASGWVWTKPIGMITLGDKADLVAASGILVQIAIKTESGIDTAAIALASALTAEGMQAKAERSAEMEKHANVLRVVIGRKP